MMKTNFDVLVVYSEKMAISARNHWADAPFDPKSEHSLCNEVYSYLLKIAENFNLRVAFTTSADIIGAGKCNSYWLVKNGSWVKVQQQASASIIFDKFFATSQKLRAQRALLFSSPAIKPFNASSTQALFSDKYVTYQSFPNESIPSVAFKEESLEEVNRVCDALAELTKQRPNDFSSDVIIKDRLGCGGEGIYRFKQNQKSAILKLLQKKSNQQFIAQPFTKFEKGFKFENKRVAADIRLVYMNGEIVDTYIRTAKKGNFLCNEHQGGLLTYVPLSAIPEKVLQQARKVIRELPTSNSLFSLDFVVSNSGNAYLIEGNSSPGLDWNPRIKDNVVKAKTFIRRVVGELVRRSQQRKQKLLTPSSRTPLISTDEVVLPHSIGV